MEPRFAGLVLESQAGEAEALAAELFELGATGLELRDAETHPGSLPLLPLEPPGESGDDSAQARRQGWQRLRVRCEEVETATGELRSFEARTRAAAERGAGREPHAVVLLAWFGTETEAERARDELTQSRPGCRPRLLELCGDEWRDRHRRAFAPFALTARITVAPPWAKEPPRARPDGVLLWLDPGRAFGTGLHATTALVAGLLEQHAGELAGEELLDVGTGSGILALAALRLGAACAVAIDVDPEAVRAAAENAARNGLADRMRIATLPVGEVAGSFGWVVANLSAAVLEGLAAELRARVRPGGRLVLSGLLAPQQGELLDRFVGPGTRDGMRFELVETRGRVVDADHWVAILLRRERSQP